MLKSQDYFWNRNFSTWQTVPDSYRQRKKRSHEKNEHLHVILDISIRHKRFFRHVYFSYCDGECQNTCDKLQDYGAYVFENVKQSNLDDAKVPRLFRYVTENPKSETQGIEAVEVTSYGESSVVHL